MDAFFWTWLAFLGGFCFACGMIFALMIFGPGKRPDHQAEMVELMRERNKMDAFKSEVLERLVEAVSRIP